MSFGLGVQDEFLFPGRLADGSGSQGQPANGFILFIPWIILIPECETNRTAFSGVVKRIGQNPEVIRETNVNLEELGNVYCLEFE